MQMIGQTFGRLLVLQEFGQDKRGNRLYSCKCECGAEVTKAGWLLRRGEIKSCGCLKRERLRDASTSHGARNTKAYGVWHNMKMRCLNPKSTYYVDYGGRGIRICDRWLSFAGFLADMGQPAAGMTLERIDNSRGYEPGNCVWATRKTQANNRRSNRLITADGQTKTLAEWASATGIDRSTISYRINSGWSAERALSLH